MGAALLEQDNYRMKSSVGAPRDFGPEGFTWRGLLTALQPRGEGDQARGRFDEAYLIRLRPRRFGSWIGTTLPSA